MCNEYISKNLSTKYYSNSIFGDLCEKCYNEKKNIFKKRTKYLKN